MQFDVIYADPPWKYENGRMKGRSAATKYETLGIDDLADLDVGSLAAQNCVLLLWAVPTMLPDALAVMGAWGFKYKTMMPWIKLTNKSAQHVADILAPHGTAELPEVESSDLNPAFGMGWWLRGCFEPILIGVRGKPAVYDQWVGLISENFAHSRKPLNLHMYGEQFGRSRLELFARERRPGWVTTGLELDALDVREFIEYAKAVENMADFDRLLTIPGA